MGKYDKLLLKILKGSSDSNIDFNELCRLLNKIGFEERVKGSHHNFRKPGIIEKINLQEDKNKAKSYQVKQVRDIIIKYKLGGNKID